MTRTVRKIRQSMQHPRYLSHSARAVSMFESPLRSTAAACSPQRCSASANPGRRRHRTVVVSNASSITPPAMRMNPATPGGADRRTLNSADLLGDKCAKRFDPIGRVPRPKNAGHAGHVEPCRQEVAERCGVKDRRPWTCNPGISQCFATTSSTDLVVV